MVNLNICLILFAFFFCQNSFENPLILITLHHQTKVQPLFDALKSKPGYEVEMVEAPIEKVDEYILIANGKQVHSGDLVEFVRGGLDDSFFLSFIAFQHLYSSQKHFRTKSSATNCWKTQTIWKKAIGKQSCSENSETKDLEYWNIWIECNFWGQIEKLSNSLKDNEAGTVWKFSILNPQNEMKKKTRDLYEGMRFALTKRSLIMQKSFILDKSNDSLFIFCKILNLKAYKYSKCSNSWKIYKNKMSLHFLNI